MVNALGMGIATALVLAASNAAVALIRRQVTDAVRLPVFVMIIAALTTCIELLMQAFTYELYQILGIFIPLITTNCTKNSRSVGQRRLGQHQRHLLGGEHFFQSGQIIEWQDQCVFSTALGRAELFMDHAGFGLRDHGFIDVPVIMTIENHHLLAPGHMPRNTHDFRIGT